MFVKTQTKLRDYRGNVISLTDDFSALTDSDMSDTEMENVETPLLKSPVIGQPKTTSKKINVQLDSLGTTNTKRTAPPKPPRNKARKTT